MILEDRRRRQRLNRRRITAAGHDQIRLRLLIGARPIPDADALRAVHHSLIHGQPLHARMLGCHDDIDVVLALNTMVEAGQQAVRVRRQIHADDIRFFVRHMVEHTRVLMGKAVVVLLPYIGGQNQVQRSDLLSPWQLIADLEPLRVLGDHRVHHANKGFIAREEAMSSGEQIALQPALAHVLAEIGVHDAPFM